MKNCFFNKNLFLTGGCGNDVYIVDFVPTDDSPIFLACFSTTTSNRVGYCDDEYTSKDVIWLPPGVPMYISTSGNDNEDCSAKESACKTIVHAQEQGIVALNQ